MRHARRARDHARQLLLLLLLRRPALNRREAQTDPFSAADPRDLGVDRRADRAQAVPVVRVVVRADQVARRDPATHSNDLTRSTLGMRPKGTEFRGLSGDRIPRARLLERSSAVVSDSGSDSLAELREGGGA
jgi:hypothetical protein